MTDKELQDIKEIVKEAMREYDQEMNDAWFAKLKTSLKLDCQGVEHDGQGKIETTNE